MLLEKLIITKKEGEQNLGFHLMVMLIQASHTNANLMMAILKIVSL